MVLFKDFILASLIIIVLVSIYALSWSREKLCRVEIFGPPKLYAKPAVDEFHASHSSWVTQFREHERKIFSQNGEDGVLLWIFSNIGTVNHPPRFVEFGVENCIECNTRFLRQHLGWQGFMMDGSHENLSINLHRELITTENINSLLLKYQTPAVIDLLSIDVDFEDYFIWKSILKAGRHRARVVVIEHNYAIPPNENRVVNPFRDPRRWTGTEYYGAGILAMAALGRLYDYTLVYAEENAVNLFFIETSILKRVGVLHEVPSIEKLYVPTPMNGRRQLPETDKTRLWIWNDTRWA